MKRILVIFFIFLYSSCFIDDAPQSELEVYRFEQYLFTTDSTNVFERLKTWHDDVGGFAEVFDANIMGRQQMTDTAYAKELLAFVAHKDMREAYDSVTIEFADFSAIEQDLESAFGRFNTYFSTYPLPEITTFFGGFNYGVVAYDNNIAIGLENFLGVNSKYYQYLKDPEYIRFQKQKKFILSNVMEVWFNEHFQKYLVERDLLSQIIHKGKAMYFIDKMLPDFSLEDKFRFTKNQMNWVVENEMNIWEYFVHEELLFSKKESEFRSFVNYAPFAKGMPKEAPGRVGYYIGYKMVNEYMDNNKITIEELMCLSNSRQFLQQSKYKPTK